MRLVESAKEECRQLDLVHLTRSIQVVPGMRGLGRYASAAASTAAVQHISALGSVAGLVGALHRTLHEYIFQAQTPCNAH